MPDPITIKPAGIPSKEAFGTPTLWLTASFSQNWVRDAYVASVNAGDDFRRHEVVFAVCLVETYLFEWVRDLVLLNDFVVLKTYFPPGRQRGIETRFKEVTKQLAADGKIKAHPHFGDRVWDDFVSIVRMRDGLVHGSISRPDNPALPEAEKPSPAPADVWTLPPGAAFAAAQRLLLSMHSAADIGYPRWLEHPETLPM